jgi:CHAD domain-containing protein
LAPGKKWIKDITSATATIDAARRVLGLRLESLRDAVGAALQERDDSFENVHQLRVAARRASAALEIFEPCLRRKAYRTASKYVRRLRRAAGLARDLDVVLLNYTKRLEPAGPEEAAALDLLCGYAVAERIPAQDRLHDACAGYPFEFERWMSDTIAGLLSPPREIGRMEALGRAYLGKLCDRIHRAIDMSAPSYEELHSLRVVAKRLRYGMEVFAGCFPPPFREELYPRIAELQEVLGVVTDAHVGLARTERLMRGLTELLPSRSGRWNGALERLAEDLKRIRLQGCEELNVWKSRVNRMGFEALFNSMLEGMPEDGPDAADAPFPVAHAS